MQDYTDFARKNGVDLKDIGPCQFCGAQTKRGIHECLEIFNLSFQDSDLSELNRPTYRFFIVDAHALQHPEIHGRWSNHFHLTRLHLIFTHHVSWTYDLSPKLSDVLKAFKLNSPNDRLSPPNQLERGKITSSDITRSKHNPEECARLIKSWAQEVYTKWETEHTKVEAIAQKFLAKE